MTRGSVALCDEGECACKLLWCGTATVGDHRFCVLRYGLACHFGHGVALQQATPSGESAAEVSEEA